MARAAHRRQTAGVRNSQLTLKQTRPQKVGVSRGPEVDFSLLQPGKGKPDESLRLDPGAFQASAGGLPKKDPFFENGKAGVARLQADRTDPITHFQYEGGGFDCQYYPKAKKRYGYTSDAAASTWTFTHDAKLSKALKSADIKPETTVGADGFRRYNIWGAEDLRRAATKDVLKCERLPNEALIICNDKEMLPYCVREGPAEKRPVHSHWQSQGIWDVMRDEPYVEQLKVCCTPGFADPGQRKKYYKSRLARLKELHGQALLSHDESMDLSAVALTSQQTHGQRRLRASRSLPPERGHFPQTQRGEIDCNGGLGRATPSEGSVRLAWTATPRQKAAPASETSSWGTPSRSRTTVGPSSTMSPVSITNAWAAARRNSTPKNAKPRDSTPPPSMHRTER